MQNAIGLGTAAIGRPQYINIRQEQPDSSDLEQFKQKGKAVLNQAYDLGIRYYDTAPGYGMAEQLLLEWLKEKADTTIEVATKWGYTYVANFDPKASQHEVKEHSLNKLNEQWEVSKELLPNLKNYQIHSATFETGVLENEAILSRLATLKLEHGLKIGLTTSGSNQKEVLESAQKIKVNGESLFDLFQVTYNMLDQSTLEIANTLIEKGKRFVVKEALANGRIFPNPNYPNYKELYTTLEELAQKYEVGLDAIALRFCIDSIKPFKVLSGAANSLHLEQNMKADTFKLEAEDIERLKQFKVQPEAYWAERKRLGWN